MTEVIESGDCGNSPKNVRVERLAIAFGTGDVEVAEEMLDEAAKWTVVGEGEHPTKAAILAQLETVSENPPARLEVHRVISHGWSGAANGLLEREDGSKTAFCQVFGFANARGTAVSEITSYLIDE